MTRNVGYIREMGLFEVIIFQRKKQQYFLFIVMHYHTYLLSGFSIENFIENPLQFYVNFHLKPVRKLAVIGTKYHRHDFQMMSVIFR